MILSPLFLIPPLILCPPLILVLPFNPGFSPNPDPSQSTRVDPSIRHMLASHLYVYSLLKPDLCTWQFNTTVQTLDLTGNDIRDKGAEYVSQMLTENLYISSLVSRAAGHWSERPAVVK